MQKRTNRLSTIVFYVLLVMIILLVITNYLTSGLFAKYLSSGESLASSNVARWEIQYINSSSLDSSMKSTHLENGSSGEWGLDIVNLSEVTAKISDESVIKLRLYSPNFHVDHHHDTWDFLSDSNGTPIDNPITFKIYLYNCSLTTLENECLEDGEFKDNVVVDGNEIVETLVFDTDDSSLEFEMVIEEGVLYYETIVNVTGLTSAYEMPSSTGEGCLRVVWNVDDATNANNVQDKFSSYHLVKTSEYDTATYLGIVNTSSLEEIRLDQNVLSSDEINTLLNANKLTIEGVDYVIAYKVHDYFEYLIYTSSLGGEVMITLEDVDGTYIKRCTKLSDEELAILNARSIALATTIEGTNKFIEKLEYGSYQEFLTAKSMYDQATGYISLGLECRIIFNLKVEQVD